jgi:bifunctional N-acetylglucosamine-1-phosphate-uridyltransferase/glucosamine-1-phosphate-acetyltransferase GlmU-like protein
MSKNRRIGPAVVILAAGQGKRMKSELPKVVFDLAGWPLIRHVIEAAKPLKAARMIAVTGHGRKLVEAAIASAVSAETAPCAARVLDGTWSRLSLTSFA